MGFWGGGKWKGQGRGRTFRGWLETRCQVIGGLSMRLNYGTFLKLTSVMMYCI